MKVNVKLYGTLPQRFKDYDSEKGIVIEMPEGACVAELRSFLGITDADSSLVAMDSLIVKPEHKLSEGVRIRFFQRVFGG